MTEYRLKYGSGFLDFSLPDHLLVDIIESKKIPAAPDQLKTVREALFHPFGTKPLNRLGKRKSAAIAINDKTRPVPLDILLPPLLDEVQRIVPAENIELFIASGTHEPMPLEEYTRILPENIIQKFRIYSHDAKDTANLTNLGMTSRGTPVQINTKYWKADLHLAVGNIEPHHFAGFSGGNKSVAIGLTGMQTINTNHAMLTHPSAKIAEYNLNPLRQDIEEMGQMIGVDFVLNAILNEKGEIVHALSGDPIDVIQKGISLSRQICMKPIEKKYDVVIAAPGGYPKDINLYQAQKALSHASLITRDGGTVILVGECREGVGSQSYNDFMEGIAEHQDVFQKIAQSGFSIGPHKALQFARECLRINVILVTDIPKEKTNRLLLESADDIEGAFGRAQKLMGSDPRVAILPRAINTIPHYVTSG